MSKTLNNLHYSKFFIVTKNVENMVKMKKKAQNSDEKIGGFELLNQKNCLACYFSTNHF